MLSDLKDIFSAASAGAGHFSSSSLRGNVAEDMVMGGGTFVNGVARNRGMGIVVRQIAPVDLCLFELGILADVVHNFAPNYSLFENQCYWFVSTICEVIVLLYDDHLTTAPGPGPGPVNYLPNLAGRWRGLLVLALKNDMIAQVAIKFTERQEEEFSKVFFIKFYLYISNYVKVQIAYNEELRRAQKHKDLELEVAQLKCKLGHLEGHRSVGF